MLGLGPLAKPLGPSAPRSRLLPLALVVTFPRSGYAALLAFLVCWLLSQRAGAALPDVASRVVCSVGMLRPSSLGSSKADLLWCSWVRTPGSPFSGPELRLESRKQGVLMVHVSTKNRKDSS